LRSTRRIAPRKSIENKSKENKNKVKKIKVANNLSNIPLPVKMILFECSDSEIARYSYHYCSTVEYNKHDFGRRSYTKFLVFIATAYTF